ncbi:MAG: hypothetical protein JST39_23995 [Bacteroidetes bacterium]|nr:hypothetical protein [Bacteroidota bacterium]
MPYTRTIFILCALAAPVFFFSRCFHNNGADNDPRGEGYAGAKTCIGCHQEIADNYAHNNHYRTSSSVTSDSIMSAVTGNDRFYFTDSSYIGITRNGPAITQSYFQQGRLTESQQTDIAFGSGEKAQTYGYWKENRLCQLPLTWYAAQHRWANSPGFPATRAHYARVIDSRCFECHASYIHKEMQPSGPLTVTETLDRNSIVYGIDCERCHGPAAKHVQYQQEHPEKKQARFITAIKSLSRQQQLDVCAVCHSGNDRSTQQSLFGFVPGDTLANFYYPDFAGGRTEPDVHGKQLQLLSQSKCFIQSQMTCGTCHSMHNGATNSMTGIIAACNSCHKNVNHTPGTITSPEQNCVSCHMPLQASRIISFNNGSDGKASYFIRTHRIAVYK